MPRLTLLKKYGIYVAGFFALAMIFSHSALAAEPKEDGAPGAAMKMKPDSDHGANGTSGHERAAEQMSEQGRAHSKGEEHAGDHDGKKEKHKGKKHSHDAD